jgi:NADH:ubiquinone reductase (H+-translocating)
VPIRLTLLESAPRILTAFPEAISASAASQLRALDVDVRTGVRVVAAAAAYLLESGQRVPGALKVWAAGIRASDSFDESGLELNRAGQLVVSPHLLVKGQQFIFALGDCASLVPEGAERPLPSTAQVANQQAQHLIRHLPVRGGRPRRSLRSLPARRLSGSSQAIVELVARPPPQRCPYCRKWIFT